MPKNVAKGHLIIASTCMPGLLKSWDGFSKKASSKSSPVIAVNYVTDLNFTLSMESL